MGNHDRARSIKFWKEHFVEVYRCPIKIGDIIYSHEPVSPGYLIEHGATVNVHGHTHSKMIDSKYYLCVSVEQIGFYPIKSKDLPALKLLNSKVYSSTTHDASAHNTVEVIQEVYKKALKERYRDRD
jgi:calcineurin-like phosphoesterase family protein